MSLTLDLMEIKDSVSKVCKPFTDEYWAARDSDGKYPFEFRDALARDGWLGIAMPSEFGGAG